MKEFDLRIEGVNFYDADFRVNIHVVLSLRTTFSSEGDYIVVERAETNFLMLFVLLNSVYK